MYLFKGLIKCLNCGKNYRGKRERNKKVYICSGYSNYSSSFCERFKIDQDDLIYVVNKHFNTNDTDEETIQSIKKITIKDQEITIYYKDGTQSFLGKNKIIY